MTKPYRRRSRRLALASRTKKWLGRPLSCSGRPSRVLRFALTVTTPAAESSGGTVEAVMSSQTLPHYPVFDNVAKSGMTTPYRRRSRASAFRALAELRSFGLVAPTARGLAIVPNAREALRLAEPRLRSSPVRESLLAAVYG